MYLIVKMEAPSGANRIHVELEAIRQAFRLDVIAEVQFGGLTISARPDRTLRSSDFPAGYTLTGNCDRVPLKP
jgi:hypothetical protein